MEPNINYDKLLYSFFQSQRRSNVIKVAEKIRALQHTTLQMEPTNFSLAGFISKVLDLNAINPEDLPILAEIPKTDVLKMISVEEVPTNVSPDSLSRLMITLHLPLNQVRILLTNSLHAIRSKSSVTRALPRSTPNINSTNRKHLLDKGLDALFVQISSQGTTQLPEAENAKLRDYLDELTQSLRNQDAEYLVS